MLKVGQIEKVEITGYSSEGMGVCRIDGCAVFVPNAIRGEVCEIRVTHVSKHSAHGKIEQILTRSPHRIPRICPEAKLCGGCQLHHMDYAEELCFKAQKVTDALNRLGGQALDVVPITGADGRPVFASAPAFPLRERRPSGPTGADEVAFDTLKRKTDGERILRCAVGALSERPSAACTPFGNGEECASCPPCDEPAEERIPRCAQNDGDGDGGAGGVPSAAYAYRNKAQYPVAERGGRPVAGFYKNRTHEVIPVARCAILPEVFDRVRDVVLRWAREDRVPVYDERTGRGLLRHIYVRRGAASGQVMVCIVANGEKLPREQRLVNALRREIEALASVVLSVNRRDTNVVLGEEFRTLWGQDFIEDTLCGFTFRLSPRSFYQVNHDQAERLYQKAVALADLHGAETVLDLYCGTGTITLALSRSAGKAIGVEVVPQAIEDAKENAARNGVANVEFFCADATLAAQKLCAEGAKPEVIVVDPPRKGLAPEVIDAIVTMAPQRVVYVSCDPATLARDVKRFSEQGYPLTHAEAFDLFPRTFHVETVVSLSQLKSEV